MTQKLWKWRSNDQSSLRCMPVVHPWHCLEYQKPETGCLRHRVSYQIILLTRTMMLCKRPIHCSRISFEGKIISKTESNSRDLNKTLISNTLDMHFSLLCIDILLKKKGPMGKWVNLNVQQQLLYIDKAMRTGKFGRVDFFKHRWIGTIGSNFLCFVIT